MYLYYLIGWRLDACRQKTADKKMIEKQKAFILALDGDVDFDPPAFELVLDRCLRNDKGKGSTDLNRSSDRHSVVYPRQSGCMLWSNSSNWKWLSCCLSKF